MFYENSQGITNALRGVWHGHYGSARCPAHDDQLPSLSLSNGHDGRLLLTCYAGCSFREIIQALRKIGLFEKQAFVDKAYDHTFSLSKQFCSDLKKACRTIAMDSDEADRKAGFTLATRAYKQGFDVSLMQAPKGTDFNDFLYSQRRAI